MSTLMTSFLLALLGAILFIAGFVVGGSIKSENKASLFGLSLQFVGVVIGIIATLNVYFNGTEREILLWLFWN